MNRVETMNCEQIKSALAGLRGLAQALREATPSPSFNTQALSEVVKSVLEPSKAMADLLHQNLELNKKVVENLNAPLKSISDFMGSYYQLAEASSNQQNMVFGINVSIEEIEDVVDEGTIQELDVQTKNREIQMKLKNWISIIVLLIDIILKLNDLTVSQNEADNIEELKLISEQQDKIENLYERIIDGLELELEKLSACDGCANDAYHISTTQDDGAFPPQASRSVTEEPDSLPLNPEVSQTDT